MSRTLTRPMFRKGGMAQREKYMGGGIKTIRPKYMGGGMTGIMSGIRPDAGLTPRVGYQEGTYQPKDYESIVAAENIGNIYTPKYLDQQFRKDFALDTDVTSDPGQFQFQYMTPDRFLPKEDILKRADILENPEAYDFFKKEYIKDKYGDKIKKQTEILKKAGDDRLANIYGSEKLKTDTPGKGDSGMFSDPLNTIGGEKNIKDEETALMKAYKEYAPIFEKELGVSDEDTKKSLYMNLAKFGAGLLAQPGGDLVGAIGKAAEKPLEGAGETVKEQSTAKRQAKLLALQTAIKENEGGPLDKTLKAIAKAQGYKGKDKLKKAFEDYEALQTNDRTFQAAETKRYAESASALGLKFSNQEKFISESKKLPSQHPELIGRFNEILPDELDEDNVGAYYVSETGRFVRVVEKDGEITAIGMNEEGFKDKPKEK